MDIIIILIIIYFICINNIKRVPPDKAAIITGKDGKKVALMPNSYYFEKKDDIIKLIDLTPKKIAISVPIINKGEKAFSVIANVTYNIKNINNLIRIDSDPNVIVRKYVFDKIQKYYAAEEYEDVKNFIGRDTIKIIDISNESLNEKGLFVKNMELRVSNSNIADDMSSTKSNFSNDLNNPNKTVTKYADYKFEKVDCIHSENTSKYISSRKEKFDDYIEKDDDEAIKNFGDFTDYGDPIKDKQKIKNLKIDDLDNEESNVDPIKNL